MKRITLMAATAAAAGVVALAGSASAQDAGWYVQGNLGGDFQSKIDGSPSAKAKNGWAVSGAGGYALGNGFRVEGEALYLDGDVKGSAGGTAKTWAGFANGYYDFKTNSNFTPFVGAGIGFANVKVDGGAVNDDDTGFAYQLKTGVDYKFNDRLTGEAAYRYLGVTSVTLGSGANRLDGDFTDQALTVGLRYKLGS
ncbi:outer membrane protein [Phenylobacterium sp.]|uniref:outer membrane protein n=1 Tax=Phenylobacterium sp. TaxID=1871053 RepID=UPI0035AFF4EB